MRPSMLVASLSFVLFAQPLAQAAPSASLQSRPSQNRQQQAPGWLGVVVEGRDGASPQIVELVPGGPAAKAGLRAGDYVLRFDASPAGDVDGLIAKVAATSAGTRVVLAIRREGKLLRIPVVLGKNPERSAARLTKSAGKAAASSAKNRSKNSPKAAQGLNKPRQAGRPFLGVTLAEEDDEVISATVLRGSAAERAGLEAGDVLLSVDGKPVKSTRGLVAQIQGHKAGDRIDLIVKRGERTLKIRARLGRQDSVGSRAAMKRMGNLAKSELARARQALTRAAAKAKREATGKARIAARSKAAAMSKLRGQRSRPQKWARDFVAARKQAARQGKPMLVDFTAQWSGPCRMLEKSFTDPAVQAQLGKYVTLRIDVDRQEELADRFGVNSIPEVVVLGPKGEKLASFTGYLPARDLASKLKRWAQPKIKVTVKPRINAQARVKSARSKKTSSSKRAPRGLAAKAVRSAAAKGRRRAEGADLRRLRADVRALMRSQKTMKKQLDELLKLVRQGKLR